MRARMRRTLLQQSEYPVRWLTFYRSVVLVLQMLGVALYLAWQGWMIAVAAQALSFSDAVVIFLNLFPDFALLLFALLAFIQLGQLDLRGYYWTVAGLWYQFFYFIVVLPSHMVPDYDPFQWGTLIWMGIFAALGLLWVIPNLVYFRHRRALYREDGWIGVDASAISLESFFEEEDEPPALADAMEEEPDPLEALQRTKPKKRKKRGSQQEFDLWGEDAEQTEAPPVKSKPGPLQLPEEIPPTAKPQARHPEETSSAAKPQARQPEETSSAAKPQARQPEETSSAARLPEQELSPDSTAGMTQMLRASYVARREEEQAVAQQQEQPPAAAARPRSVPTQAAVSSSTPPVQLAPPIAQAAAPSNRPPEQQASPASQPAPVAPQPTPQPVQQSAPLPVPKQPTPPPAIQTAPPPHVKPPVQQAPQAAASPAAQPNITQPVQQPPQPVVQSAQPPHVMQAVQQAPQAAVPPAAQPNITQPVQQPPQPVVVQPTAQPNSTQPVRQPPQPTAQAAPPVLREESFHVNDELVAQLEEAAKRPLNRQPQPQAQEEAVPPIAPKPERERRGQKRIYRVQKAEQSKQIDG